LPGLKKEDIKLEMDNSVLTISGERLRDAAGEGRYSERPSGKFARVLTLPAQVDAEKIEAHFVNGVLNITVPKAESAKSRSIKIM
jgi:HSP20 family protein